MDLSMILKIVSLIISTAVCCFSFYDLGYLKGSEDERALQWSAQSSLQDLIRRARKTIDELRLKILEYELKQENNIKQNNEQQ